MSKIKQRTTNINGSWEVEDNLSLAPKAPKSILLDVVSMVVVDENIKRKGLIIINGSGDRISLAFGVDAILDKGIILYPGGTFNMGEEDFYSGRIYGIAAIVDSLLAIQEFS
jgi:hypothetical protein